MKSLKLIGLIFLTLIVLSCKKNDTGTNWTEEMKASVWPGDFKYTPGAYTDLQPFSISLNKYLYHHL